MKSLKEYYGTGSMYYSNSDYDRKSVYKDMPSKERKRLDQMAMNKFGRMFVDCTFDEQSGLRSLYQDEVSGEDEREDVQKEIEKSAEEEKKRLEKEADKTLKADEVEDDGTDDNQDVIIDDESDEDFDEEE